MESRHVITYVTYLSLPQSKHYNVSYHEDKSIAFPSENCILNDPCYAGQLPHLLGICWVAKRSEPL